MLFEIDLNNLLFYRLFNEFFSYLKIPKNSVPTAESETPRNDFTRKRNFFRHNSANLTLSEKFRRNTQLRLPEFRGNGLKRIPRLGSSGIE